MEKQFKTVIKLLVTLLVIVVLGWVIMYSKVSNIDNNVIQLSSNLT